MKRFTLLKARRAPCTQLTVPRCLRSTLSDLCHKPYAMYHVPYAIYNMPYALCPMHYALRTTPYANILNNDWPLAKTEDQTGCQIMVSAMEIYQLLPKTNCKKCGVSTCMAYAVGLLSKEKKIEDCPILFEPKYEAKLKKLQEVMAPILSSSETGLIIHGEKCFGCGNCVVACPVNVANDPHGCAVGLGPKSEKAILVVEDGVIKCLNPKECRRFGPGRILCNACTATCPSKAIEFV
jgi:4Fe-4S ferredoxin